MGYFQQLKLVLGKNFTLRRRQPVLLAIEILWPVLIFVVVMVVRQVTLPKESKSCKFAERALPSVGVVPFLQSFICGLENECLNETYENSSAYGNARINPLVSNMSPIMRNRTLRRVMRDLPATVALLNDLQELLKDDGLKQLLDKNFTLREIITDPNDLKMYLTETLRLFSPQVVDTLLDSSVNISQVMRLQSDLDIPTLLCNSDALRLYLILPEKTQSSMPTVSDQLCRLNKTYYDAVMKKLQDSVNISKVLHTTSQLSKLWGDTQMSIALNDVAKMVSTVQKMKFLDGFSSVLPSEFQEATKIMPNFLQLVAATQDPAVDFKLVDSMLNDVQNSYGQTTPTINTLKNLANYAKSMMEVTNVQSITDKGLQAVVEIMQNPSAIGQLMSNRTTVVATTLQKILSSNQTDILKAVYQTQSVDEFRKFLCNSTNRSNSATAQSTLPKELCENNETLTVVWKTLKAAVDVNQLVAEADRNANKDTNRGNTVEQLGKNLMKLKENLSGELDNPHSSLSQIKTFLDQFRVSDMIPKRYRRNANSTNFNWDWRSVVNKGLKMLFNNSTSQVWETLNRQAYLIHAENQWLSQTIMDFSTKKMTFGGLFDQPATVDDLISAAAEYLPVFLDSEMLTYPSAEWRSLVANPTQTRNLRYYMCVQPGFRRLINSDTTANLSKIYQVQEKLCRLDMDQLLNELNDQFQMNDLMKQITSYDNQVDLNFKMEDLMQSGYNLSQLLQNETLRYGKKFSNISLSDLQKVYSMITSKFEQQTTPENINPTLSQLLVETVNSTEGKPSGVVLHKLLETVDDQLSLYSDVTDTTGVFAQMVAFNAQYAPYITELILMNFADSAKIAQSFDMGNAYIPDVMCKKPLGESFKLPDLPEPLGWDQYQKFICNLDYAKVQQTASGSALKVDHFRERLAQLTSEDHQPSAQLNKLQLVHSIRAKFHDVISNGTVVYGASQTQYDSSRLSIILSNVAKNLSTVSFPDFIKFATTSIRKLQETFFSASKNDNQADLRSGSLSGFSSYLSSAGSFLTNVAGHLETSSGFESDVKRMMAGSSLVQQLMDHISPVSSSAKDLLKNFSHPLSQYMNQVKELANEAYGKLGPMLDPLTSGLDTLSNQSALIREGTHRLRYLKDQPIKKITDACQAAVSSLEPKDLQSVVWMTRMLQSLTGQMSQTQDYTAAVCNISTMSLQELYDGVTTGDKLQILQANHSSSEVPNCTSFADLSLEAYSSATGILSKFQPSNIDRQLVDCLQKADFTAAKDFDKYLDLTAGLTKFLSTPHVLDSIQKVTPVITKGMELVENNVPVYARLSIYFKSADDVNYYLAKLNMSKALADVVQRVNVDINSLSQVSTPMELRDIICTPRKLNRFALAPPADLSLVSAELCRKGSNVVETIFNSVDMKKLQTELPRLRQLKLSDQRWLTELMEKGSQIFSKFSELTRLANDVQLDVSEMLQSDDSAGQQLEALYKLYFDNKIFKMQQTMKEATEDVASILGGSRLVDDVENILDGVSGINDIRTITGRILQQKYPITDLFINPKIIVDFLGNQLHLDENTTAQVLDARLSIAELAKGAKFGFSHTFCDPFEMSKVVEGNSLNVIGLAETLCNANITVKLNSTMDFIKQIKFSELFKQYMLTSLSSRFEKSGLYSKDNENLLESVSEMPQVLPALMNAMRSFRSVDGDKIPSSYLNTGKLLADSVVASDSISASPVQILCGKPVKMFDSLSNQNSEEISSDSEAKELGAFATPYCTTFYRSLMKSDNGTIIWRLIKPFLMGIIAVTPDTPETRLIVHYANSTFDELYSWFTLAKSGRNISEGLEVLTRDRESSRRLKHALNSPIVQAALANLIHLNPEFLLSSLENLETLDMEQNKKIETLTQSMAKFADCILFDRFRFYTNEKQLESDLGQFNDGTLLAAVVFLNLTSETRPKRAYTELPEHKITLPKVVKYKIRMNPDLVPKTTEMSDRHWDNQAPGALASSLRYLLGFIEVQDIFDTAIIHAQTDDKLTTDLNIFLKQIPFPCFEKDLYLLHLKYWLALFMLAAWLLATGFLIKSYVYDSEKGLTQMMRVMGLKPGVRWFGWFITSFTIMLIVAIVIMLFLKLGQILPSTNWFLLLLVLIDFVVVIIMFSCLISTFFSKTTVAALTGVIMYLMAFLPFIVINMTWELHVPFAVKVISSFAAPSAFSFVCTYMAMYEEDGTGLQWSNIGISPIYDDKMNCSLACWLMVADSIIYGIIAWYISNVFPKAGEAKRNWLFFLSNSYWLGTPKLIAPAASLDDPILTNHSNNHVGLDSNWLRENDKLFSHKPKPIGVVLKNLSKTYGHGAKPAVENLTMEFYEGSIIGLLGHNGAGKTTTINMLTGMSQPTSGSARIYGYDISTEFQWAQKFIGICPQYNILFDRLTVREHLTFYASLKGTTSNDQLEFEVNKMLDDIGLTSVQHRISVNLSGGMKRRLCIGIAFISGSKTVILDEPTAGIDPVARRFIWDIINKNKKGRTILLCTHHLDEADILCDRIAVLHQGKLLCCGTSEYLKSRFGSGYQLRITNFDQSKTLEQTMTQEDAGKLQSYLNHAFTDLNVESDNRVTLVQNTSILDFVRTFIPGAQLLHSVGTESTILLPIATANDTTDTISTNEDFDVSKSPLVELLTELEETKDKFRIMSYGITECTLEEVFLTVCSLADEGASLDLSSAERIKLLLKSKEKQTKLSEDDVSLKGSTNHLNFLGVTKETKKETSWEKPNRLTGWSLTVQQTVALLLKRLHHNRRDWKTLVSGFVLPCIFVALAMGFNVIKPTENESGPLDLYPEIYGVQGGMFYAGDQLRTTSQQEMFKSLVSNKGVGSYCLAQHDKCQSRNVSFSTDYIDDVSAYDGHFKSCRCDLGRQICPKGSEATVAPRMPTGFSYLYDYSDESTDNNLELFLLQSYSKFSNERMGGWSWGQLSGNLENAKPVEYLKVWFSSFGHHTMPSYLNTANNMKLRVNLKGKDSSDYGIITLSEPLPRRDNQLDQEGVMSKIADVGIGLVFLCGYSFIPGSLIMYTVQERMNKEKQLQFLAGVGPVLYWIVSFAWDLSIYGISVVFGILIMAISRLDVYTANLNLPATALLLLLYGFACLPQMYLFQRCFVDRSIAYVVLFCLAVFIGINTMVCVMLLTMLNWVSGLNTATEVVKGIFLLFPQYCLGGGLVDLAKNQVTAEVYQAYGKSGMYKNPFSTEVIGWNYLALFIEGVGLMTIVILMEFRFPFSSYKSKSSRIPTEIGKNEDEDVYRERRRILTKKSSSDVLSLVSLSKTYRSVLGKNKAVRKVCLGVPRGECFGLLGLNGAGKTSTFQMITGGLEPSMGEVLLNGKRLTGSSSKCTQDVGYCPQEDACDPLLTGTELLTFHARLRGYQSAQLDKIVRSSLKRFELVSNAEKVVKTYSGGNKRKLSTAIALMGNPQLVLLDEPTSGMDPATRRLVWDNVNKIVKEGRSVLLTSHSMEECDAMCTRLAIMVNGGFTCLGSPQHLKQKFGRGYTVKIRLGHPKDVPLVVHFMQESFAGSVQKDLHAATVEFLIPTGPSGSLARIFQLLECQRSALQIRDYSVSQTTLDQIFIDFAKQQRDGMPMTVEVDKSRSATSLRQSALTYPSSRPVPTGTVDYSGYRGLAYHNPLIEISDEAVGFKTNPLTVTEDSRERDTQSVSIDFTY